MEAKIFNFNMLVYVYLRRRSTRHRKFTRKFGSPGTDFALIFIVILIQISDWLIFSLSESIFLKRFGLKKKKKAEFC